MTPLPLSPPLSQLLSPLQGDMGLEGRELGTFASLLEALRTSRRQGKPAELEHYWNLLLRSAPGSEARKQRARRFHQAVALAGHPFTQGMQTTFLARAPGARQVTLAGSFNQWNSRSHPLKPWGEGGLFAITLEAALPGTYKFVVDGVWGADPANPLAEPDGYGGQNSCLEPFFEPALVTWPGFFSSALKNRRPVHISLPPGYATAREHYPVLYVLDGEENLRRGRLPALLREAQEAGRLPPLIAVFLPNLRRRDHEYTPFFKHSRVDAFHRFLALEVVPGIDRLFRTVPDPAARILLGQSFGGTAVASLALRAPSLFKHVLVQSGVFAWGERRVNLLFAARPRQDLRLYLDCVANPMEEWQARLMVHALSHKGYPFFMGSYPTRHEYEDWCQRVPAGLRYLLFGIRPGRGPDDDLEGARA